MNRTDRIRLIWWVRGTLGPRGMLTLAGNPVNPATDPGLRQLLIVACNRGDLHNWADDRGLIRHGPGQLVDEPPGEVCTWQQVWELIAPGITPERVEELQAAWAGGYARRRRSGEHTDMRLHLACCAFFQPPPVDRPVQLNLLDLIGAKP